MNERIGYLVTVLLAAFGLAAVIQGWRFLWRELGESSRLRANNADLRQALRERDAAGREPERVAFQSGYRLGLNAALSGTEIPVECDCAACKRGADYSVN